MNNDVLLDINGIKKLIPHRYPFLLVDKIVDFKKDEYIIGVKNVTANEEYFNGHFPSFPIMPGVLIVEALAQTSAIFHLMSLGIEENTRNIFFMGIDDCKFRKPTFPGDTLFLKVLPISSRGKIIKVRGEAYNKDTLICSATLTAMAGV